MPYGTAVPDLMLAVLQVLFMCCDMLRFDSFRRGWRCLNFLAKLMVLHRKLLFSLDIAATTEAILM